MEFTKNREDMWLESQIADRIVEMSEKIGLHVEKIGVVMDIDACHNNGTPLNLQGLLKASDSDLWHDAWGIRRHLDRKTGKLNDCFLPRYALT